MKNCWIAGVAIFCGLGVHAASACIPDDEYVHPTNYQLVEMADAIAVGTAVKVVDTPGGEGAVEFRTDVILKGNPASTFVSAGSGLEPETNDNPADTVRDSIPDNPCGCSGATFVTNSQYVVFLYEDDGGFFSVHFICAPWQSLYLGDTSLWVTAIRAYVEIAQTHDRMEALDALDALSQRLSKQADAQRLQPFIDDIRTELTSLSKYKPTAHLIDAYERLERGEVLRFHARQVVDPHETKTHVLASLARGEHPSAAGLFDRLLAGGNPDHALLGRAIQFYAHHGQYRRAYDIVVQSALPLLVRGDPEQIALLLERILAVQSEIQPRSEIENWRSDPHTAKAWPELALDLYSNVERRDPDVYSRRDYLAITEIPVTDYSARPALTRALATLGDKSVVAWATKEVDRDADVSIDLALEVLVRESGKEARAALAAAFCQGGQRRLAAITMLGRFGRFEAELVGRMLMATDLTPAEQTALEDAIVALAARGGIRAWGDLLDRIRDPSKPMQDVQPLRCPG